MSDPRRQRPSTQPPAQRLAIILVAAGSGARLGGDVPKQFRDFEGEPLLLRGLRTLVATRLSERTLVVVPQGYEERVASWLAQAGLRADAIVTGGATRQESVRRALACLRQHDDWRCTHVLVHDAARPFVSAELVRAVVAAVHETGAATLAIPVSDTLMRASRQTLESAAHDETPARGGESIDRNGMWAIQTPQVFARELLERAHAAAPPEGAATDDGSLVLALGCEVRFVPGAWWNLKVTHREDLDKARVISTMRRMETATLRGKDA